MNQALYHDRHESVTVQPGAGVSTDESGVEEQAQQKYGKTTLSLYYGPPCNR